MYIIVNTKDFRLHGETFETIEEAFETLVSTYGTRNNWILAKTVNLYLELYNKEEYNLNGIPQI